MHWIFSLSDRLLQLIEAEKAKDDFEATSFYCEICVPQISLEIQFSSQIKTTGIHVGTTQVAQRLGSIFTNDSCSSKQKRRENYFSRYAADLA